MSTLFILFKVGDGTYGLPGTDVVQLESFAGATRVPGSSDYVLGLMQLRNHLVPVVDLRLRFGLPAAPVSIDSRVVVVERAERRVALLVDSAREVVSLDPQSFVQPPEAVSQRAKGFVKSISNADGRIVMLIDCDRVISHEEIYGQPHVDQS